MFKHIVVGVDGARVAGDGRASERSNLPHIPRYERDQASPAASDWRRVTRSAARPGGL